jgi:hypothetical protein
LRESRKMEDGAATVDTAQVARNGKWRIRREKSASQVNGRRGGAGRGGGGRGGQGGPPLTRGGDGQTIYFAARANPARHNSMFARNFDSTTSPREEAPPLPPPFPGGPLTVGTFAPATAGLFAEVSDTNPDSFDLASLVRQRDDRGCSRSCLRCRGAPATWPNQRTNRVEASFFFF